MPEGRKSPTDCGKLMFWAWVGYHARKGPHFLSRHDWQKYMAYIRKHMDD